MWQEKEDHRVREENFRGEELISSAECAFVHANRSRDLLDGRPGASVQFVHSSSASVRRHTDECVAHVDKPPHLYHEPEVKRTPMQPP